MTNQNEGAVSPLVESAIVTHEMYSAYVTAGFTPDQAIKLVVGMMAASASMMPQNWIPPNNGKG